jgi:hypothetical protein
MDPQMIQALIGLAMSMQQGQQAGANPQSGGLLGMIPKGSLLGALLPAIGGSGGIAGKLLSSQLGSQLGSQFGGGR